MRKKQSRVDGQDITEYVDAKGRTFVEKKDLLRAVKAADRYKGSYKTNFRRWGNSIAVRIPQRLLKELKAKENDSALILKEGGSLVIFKQ
ncbi:MAG: hypothetical protein V1735_08020 [Nanoarchaeota archaeon]